MSEIETSEMSRGNTKSLSISGKTQITQSRYWCFTWNNYDLEESEQNEIYFQKHGFLYVMGFEVGESGTPHIQGYLEHEKRFRPSELKFEKTKWNSIHWEKRKGSRQEAGTYCMKDGNYKTNMNLPRPVVLMTRDRMRPEQLAIADKFKEREDPLFGRNIHWYWEETGNWGKSVLKLYMVDQMGAIEVGGGAKDTFCGIAAALEKRDVPIVIFDIPRASSEYVSYQAIEKIKDGCFFSPKYESGMVRFNKPHIICFANERPQEEKMSLDRWRICHLGSI